MVDVSKIHNPYDFANPVSDVEIFVGREAEMREIKYYLDHAKSASRPINIAVLGERSSGKTSLLNMTEIEALDRGFCAVRIDLDEGDAKNELVFFHKIFDSLFTVVCQNGAFGGVSGKTYDTYLDIVNTYLVPEDKTFCPFLFPLQYAKALSAGNIDARMSDYNYKNDLRKIYLEVNCPILLLFDEGNVLANSRVHLEKLRNIFMNTPGFMLIMTGTPALFPLMDEVFSPIVRQFAKINVTGFRSRKETQQCIENPLYKVGIKPKQVFDFNPNDIQEIHELSSGHPYEIQLICHMLFRRIQLNEARKMKLTLGVLEDVRKQLETSQDIAARPILTRIHSLESKQLSALDLLCACDERANFNQIWTVEYIYYNEKRWTKDALYNELEHFIDWDIIEVDKKIEDLGFKPQYASETIKFAGDDFDRIYIKYFAREQGVPLNLAHHRSLSRFWLLRANSLMPFTQDFESIDWTNEGIVSDAAINSIMDRMSPEPTDEDIFSEGLSIVESLYFLMFDYREKKNIPFIRLKITLPWLQSHSWYYCDKPDNSNSLADRLHLFEELEARAQKIGADLKVEWIEVPVTPIEALSRKIKSSSNTRLKDSIIEGHIAEMALSYIDERNVEKALLHANTACYYKANPTVGINCNNMGYLFMSTGDLRKAKRLFERAIKLCKEPANRALALYNRGILHIKDNELEDALNLVEEASKLARKVNKNRREMGCLFVARLVNGDIKLDEVMHPDLLMTSQETRKALNIVLKREGI